MKKIRIFFWIIVLTTSFGLIHTLACLNITSHYTVQQSGEEYVAELQFPDNLETSKDSYTQFFSPQHSDLSELRIRLAFNHEAILEEYPPEAWFILKQGDETIQTQQIDINNDNNWRYYSLTLHCGLEGGKKYSLSLVQLGGYTDPETNRYPLSVMPFINHIDEQEKWLPESVSCAYNDSAELYEWDMVYIYKKHDYMQFGWLILTDLIGALVIIMFRTLKLYEHNFTCYVLAMLVPPVNFLFVEIITGNINTVKVSCMFLNIAIYYAILCILILFFKKIKDALLIFSIFCTSSGLVGYYVYKLRGRPFMIQDLSAIQTAQKVMKQYTYEVNNQVAIAVILSLFTVILILQLPETKLGKQFVLQKFGAIAITGAMGVVLSDNSICILNLWDIESNYQTYGYFLTLASEVCLLNEQPPDGYSIQAVKEIAENDRLSKEPLYEDVSITPQNIIMIMNESWGDFRYISSFYQDSTITPYIDSLSGKNVIKGNLHVPIFGGGTANSEYEVLTGNSVQFIGAGETPYQVHVSSTNYSIVSSLKAQEYEVLAMHPNSAGNWNRDTVYANMGFDQFISSENWPETYSENIRGCMSDLSSYETLIEQYKRKDKNDKLFTFLVTMQNHGGYVYDGYESTVNLDYDTSYPLTEQYLSLLKESDSAFETLIDYFQTTAEPTMIVMFGDHLPSVDISFYEMLFGVSWNDISLEKQQKMYTTPFIIWTNYELDHSSDITELSANYFGSYVLKMAGLKLPVYNQCLLNYMSEIPVIGHGMIMDSEGCWYDFEHIPRELENVFYIIR